MCRLFTYCITLVFSTSYISTFYIWRRPRDRHVRFNKNKWYYQEWCAGFSFFYLIVPMHLQQDSSDAWVPFRIFNTISKWNDTTTNCNESSVTSIAAESHFNLLAVIPSSVNSICINTCLYKRLLSSPFESIPFPYFLCCDSAVCQRWQHQCSCPEPVNESE